MLTRRRMMACRRYPAFCKEVYIVLADDVPRYRKKKNKNTPTKADHKHEFIDCVFEYDSIRLDKAHGWVPDPKFAIGSYCPVCGRIGTMHNEGWWDDGEKLPSGALRAGNWSAKAQKEFDPETRTLPFFRVEDIFRQKFIKQEGKQCE